MAIAKNRRIHKHPVMSSSLWYLLIVPGIPIAIMFIWMFRWIKKRNKHSRRPFKDMPRPPGWSLQSRTEDLMADFLFNTMMIVITGALVWACFMPQDRVISGMVFGLAVSGLFLYRVQKDMIRYANCKLGLMGELIVGGVLDRLSSDSISVFHDLQIKETGKKPWNIDHIAITPAGVFLFETKARRKMLADSPDGQKGHKVIYDGVHLHFPKPMRPDRFGIEQAERNADCLSAKLTQLNGIKVSVKAALVLPGWFIETKGKSAVTVLNEKQIPMFLNSRSETLPPDRLRAICGQLQDMAKVEFG